MTDIATLRQNTLDKLYGLPSVEHPIEDTLASGINDSVAALEVDTEPMWKRDNYAEFIANDEIVRFAEDASGSTAVRRAQLGTQAAVQSFGAVMVKNPVFPGIRVKQAVEEVVRQDLWPWVWTWHTDSLTWGPVNTMYPLDQWVEDVVLVYQENIDGEEEWHPIPNGWWDVERQITTVANSNMLRLRKVHEPDELVYYVGKRRPDTSSAGLTAMSNELADMVPWAAAAKLLAMRSPAVKNDAARTRHDKDGGLLRDYRALMAEFLRMRDQHARHLQLEVRVEPRFRKKFRRRW